MKKSWYWIFLISGVIVLGVIFAFLGEAWDKNDWIFLFLVVGIIVLNVKLNKLLSKKKKS